MRSIALKSKRLLLTFSSFEKNYKLLTYITLLILTISTYVIRNSSEEIKIEFAALKEKNKGIKESILIFNDNYEGMPLPVWSKVKRGNHFILQYVNKAFIEEFGHSFNKNRYNIIGKNNFEVFPKKIAQNYYENDIAVSIAGEPIVSYPQFIDKKGLPHDMKVVKWREIVEGKDTIVFGMVKEILPIKKDLE